MLFGDRGGDGGDDTGGTVWECNGDDGGDGVFSAYISQQNV